MASGLIALLDDVAAIARLAAASVDDVAAASLKASSKAMGVVVDDAAVTPKYVAGLSPARELPIIWPIAKGSLRNMLLFLLPAALLLSAFAPWIITPILMIGGLYLAYEGAEKIIAVSGHGHTDADDDDAGKTPGQIEDDKIAGAVRTDFILSAEIMAIALSEVSSRPIVTQAAALLAVSLLITAGVYGVVALIVKMDDIGLHLAGRAGGLSRAVGRGLVAGMPVILSLLARIGTVAMLWVGGGILIHGLEEFHLETLPHAAEAVAHAIEGLIPFAPGFGAWFGFALASALVGLVAGGILAMIVPVALRAFGRRPHG